MRPGGGGGGGPPGGYRELVSIARKGKVGAKVKGHQWKKMQCGGKFWLMKTSAEW